MEVDYSMDAKIWNNGKDYFIDVRDFDKTKKTQLPKGTELTVYNEQNQKSEGVWFSSPNGIWVEY